MNKTKFARILSSLLIALLVISSLPTLAFAAAPSAPAAQQVRDTQVKGTLPGGQFAKIWLGLQPAESGATITVIAEWDRPDALANGVGFFIIDEATLATIGDSPLSAVAIAGGDPGFILNGPSNQMGAAIGAVGLTNYTLVVYNDSASDANFTLTASNAFITDGSNQVTGVNSAPTATAEAVTETTADAATADATATPVPAEAAAVTATTPTTTTTTATTTTAPAAATNVTVANREVRATTMKGELAGENTQHFLGLQPSQRDGNLTVTLVFDPQDSSELARRLNFWVLDEAGLTAFLRGTSPGEVAIAAGNRTFLGDSNERVASFNAAGTGLYTVIVYNNSRIPGTYTLTVEGGELIDDSNQTLTAQAANAGALSSTAAVTGTTTTTTTTSTTTTAAAATAATPVATTAASARSGEPGGSYTVKSGDTMALIARDIYGDLQLYDEICAFNGIANCDVIEVGDVIRLPTLAQIQSGATAATAPAQAAATPTATPVATRTAATTTLTTTLTATATLTATTPATTTTGVTSTRSLSGTAATGTSAATSMADSGTIMAVLAADGRFTSLIEALQATGLDSVLEGSGPFTLFAPTDAAFAALQAGAFEQLLNDPGGQLTDILRYHVVAGETLAADLSNGAEATTVQGKSVRFEVQGSTIKINGATLVTKDMEASNGVIHAIDAVILPPPE